jgi:glycerol transport system ATP-binding protein
MVRNGTEIKKHRENGRRKQWKMTLTLENISKTVGGESHIDDVSMTLEPGSFNVLLGRTLAGKTTLMRIMAGLEPPSSGRIMVDNVDVTGMAVQKRNVAMVYQQFINYPSMNVYDNIASPLKLQGVAKAEIDKRVRSTAELMHIEHLLDRLPQELSGGQQQRTAMARAMVKDCKLLLLDEPLVNLDYKLREELREEIPNLRRNATPLLSMPRPNRWKPCFWAGNVRSCMKAASPSLVRPHRFTTTRPLSRPA